MAMQGENPAGGVRRVRRTTRKLSDEGIVDRAPSEQPAAAPPRVVALPASLGVPRFGSVGNIRSNDINNMLRQLIMLLEAGTPLLKAMKTLSERGEKASVRALISDMSQYIETGNPLWQAFDRHPKYFDTVFVNLIKASEASGTLVTVLQRVVSYRERRELLKKRVRGAMFYPAILVLACFGAVVFISEVVVPTFVDLFKKFDTTLPPLTKGFIATSTFVSHYWVHGIILVVVIVAVYKLWYVQNPLRRLRADYMKLKIPIIGPILRKNALVEMTRTLALLLKSGLSMMATLELVRNAIHNRAVAQTLQAMRDSVESGAGLEIPLRQASGVIPSVVADMMVTGEESGRLDSIADQIANTYEEEVNIAIATLGDALQPILTIVIGVFVILLMLAVFMPLVSMMNSLGGGGEAAGNV